MASQPAASQNYLDLILSKEGELEPDIEHLRSQVLHLEPTLSYAIAWTGYEQTAKVLRESLQDAWQRLKIREQVLLSAVKIGPDVWKLRDDVGRLQELLVAMGGALNNLKRNKLQFERDIHESVVDMVRVRWELERCDF